MTAGFNERELAALSAFSESFNGSLATWDEGPITEQTLSAWRRANDPRFEAWEMFLHGWEAADDFKNRNAS